MNVRSKYNKEPKDLGFHKVDVKEYFSYTYLPIKLAGSCDIRLEKRLEIFNKIVGAACCDFVGSFGLDRFSESYVYLTAKHQYQKPGCGFNRPGWHSDGFGTDDINYIWSNRQPTIFNNSDFSEMDSDDEFSMLDMDRLANSDNDYCYGNGSLIRMDQFTIHRTGDYVEGNRAFMKLSISRDIYALEGNSINYDLDYEWEYKPRRKQRNIPQGKV